MDRYVVIGNPVSHSKSPQIHTWFAEQTGQALEYTALLSEQDSFPETVAAFFGSGGKGANVTVPFKEEAFRLAEILSEEAATAGAVNTLWPDASGKLHGHNTDGVGLVRDICSNHEGTLAGKRILVLGAGGATRGILQPFIKQGPAEICIANRTVNKAEDLAEQFAGAGEDAGVHVSGCGFFDLPEQPFDWIINATSASLQGELPPVPPAAVAGVTWCYDLMYGSEPTPFCSWSRQAGAGNVMDGLGMLVEQAAESFLAWRGVRPETRPVIERLRSG